VSLFEMALLEMMAFPVKEIENRGSGLNTLSLLSEAGVLNCGKDSLRLLGDIYNVKGVYFGRLDSLALAIKYYLISYEIYSVLNDGYRRSKVLYNLVFLLFYNGLYNTASFYADESLALAFKMNSPKASFRALSVKVLICRIREQWDSVKYYIAQEAIAGEKLSDNSGLKDMMLYHRALLYDHEGKSDSVLIFLNAVKADRKNYTMVFGSSYVLNYLQLGREREAKIKLDELIEFVEMAKIENDKTNIQPIWESELRILTFAYNLYKETKTNSWIPAFKKHILSLPEKTLLLQGQNKVAEIFGFDENFAKADYLVTQAEVKAQEMEIKLKGRSITYWVTFFIVALVLLALLLFFFTKMRRLMAQEGRINERLAQNNSYLQLYDRAMGHDLTSPLALINDCAQTIKEGNLDESFKRYLLDALSEQSALALQQVRGLLRLGISSDSVQHLALSSQLLPLVQEGQRLAGVFDNPVRVQGAEGLPLVLMNADALKQIFQNMFSNSLNHSGRGKAVEIYVKGEYKPKSKFCTITISDNGSGISSRARDFIFDLGTTSTIAPGTGLGLGICKILMDMFGGSLGYKSEPDGGACFVLNVKVA